MSVELTYNGKRYMVDGGKWFRRLEVGEITDSKTQWRDTHDKWIKSISTGSHVFAFERNDYRVHCSDPRPPFVVGQRVKVARADGERCVDFIGREGYVLIVDRESVTVAMESGNLFAKSWCLDPVDPFREHAVLAQECGMDEYTHNPLIRDPHPTGEPEEEIEGYKHVPMEKVGTIVGKFVPVGAEPEPRPTGEPCLSWILGKLAKQPEKRERTLQVLQRAMSELVRLEAE